MCVHVCAFVLGESTKRERTCRTRHGQTTWSAFFCFSYTFLERLSSLSGEIAENYCHQRFMLTTFYPLIMQFFNVKKKYVSIKVIIQLVRSNHHIKCARYKPDHISLTRLGSLWILLCHINLHIAMSGPLQPLPCLHSVHWIEADGKCLLMRASAAGEKQDGSPWNKIQMCTPPTTAVNLNWQAW